MPGFDSTSPDFVRSRGNQAARSEGRLSQNEIGRPSMGGRDCIYIYIYILFVQSSAAF